MINGFKVITMCGSTKFKEDHLKELMRLTLEGNIVLSCPFYDHSENLQLTNEQCSMIANMHEGKINISDAIFVVNKNGYIGESTQNEIDYAYSKNIEVIYMEK